MVLAVKAPAWVPCGAEHPIGCCDRTTSEMRGLSPQDRSRDSQWSENT
jgi:hypothetical protein